MRADQFIDAAVAVRNIAALDEITRLTWRAMTEGQISEADAERVDEALQARRAVLKAKAGPGPKMAALSRRRQVAPDKRQSIERRRAIAASGALPPAIASSFTQGQVAALTVIARHVQRGGRCELPIDAIAAMAGTCRSLVQSALRDARRLGLISVQERRRAGQKSDTNVVSITDGSWLAWLRLKGGGRVQIKKHHEYRDLDSEKKAESPVISGTRPYRTGGMASGKPRNQMKMTTKRHVV